MLYTKTGDLGDTGVFGCDQRISKSSAVAEALGALDEINSFLGINKFLLKKDGVDFEGEKFFSIIHQVQENLFIIQSQVAGADKKILKSEIEKIENLIDSIEKILPKIDSFFISGERELSSYLDFARVLVRKSERRVVAVAEENIVNIDKNTLVYLNRLSSLFYALTRFINFKKGVIEKKPKY